jgi:5-carboxymethyl-2-hydroxymuconate isomerase|tara:strand:+ start:1009 stop:1377 length:369 start_codon:yes stop_codon:yes gene_type:complete
MPHFIFEYSANLDKRLLDIDGLMRKMHDVAADTNIFPVAGIRIRAMKCVDFLIGDGSGDKGFINLSMKVGHGRDESVRMQVGEQVWQTMLAHLRPLMAKQPVSCSFEMRELEAQLKFNHRNF